MKTIAAEEGKLSFADEAVAAAAVWLVNQVEGVARVVGQSDNAAGRANRDRLPKGVAVDTRDGGVVVHLELVVRFGIDISAVATNAIQAVGAGIQEHLGFKVDNVQITVVDVEPPR